MSLLDVSSFAVGEWIAPGAGARSIASAITGAPLAQAGNDALDVQAMLAYARDTGGPALRALTFHDRARMIKALAAHLGQHKQALYDLSFAPGREALSSYRLRDGVLKVADLCLVARDELGIVSAAIRYWPVHIGAHDALLLGPVAVHPTRQGEGLGRALIEQSLDHAAPLGWTRVMLVGDASYYCRYGFSLLSGVIMPPPTNPARVLGRAIKPMAWAGVVGNVLRWQD